MEDFDEIYILNLHGNSKRQEKTPEEGKDENVFDIQQGVSIILLIKDGSSTKKINYADLWGLREGKYKFLEEKDVENTKWQELTPKEPQNFFVIKDFSGSDTYNVFFGLENIFTESSSGVKTHRDHFITDLSKQTLKNRILSFISSNDEVDVIRDLYEIPNTVSFVLEKSIVYERKRGYDEKLLVPYFYKPFDFRWIYYSEKLIDRDRKSMLGSFLKDNTGLVLMRKIVGSKWEHAFVTDSLIDINFYGFQTYVFPLYVDTDNKVEQQTLIPNEQEELDIEGAQHTLRLSSKRRVNFQQSFLDFIDNSLIFPDPAKRKISYEEILYYIYAVFYSNIYRQKYQEFLKIDFPKIPFTKNYQLFKKLAGLGEVLVNLHLLKSETLDKPIAKFQGKDINLVEKREYKDKKVYINESQYFEKVDESIWNYYIGGYQVLDKWLKDRKGRILSSDDIKHYCKVSTALSETIKIQSQIDSLYPKVEKSLV